MPERAPILAADRAVDDGLGAGQQALQQVGPDEPGGAGQQDVLGVRGVRRVRRRRRQLQAESGFALEVDSRRLAQRRAAADGSNGSSEPLERGRLQQAAEQARAVSGFDTQGTDGAGDHLRSQQRVPAHSEEVVVQRRPDPQGVLPDPRQGVDEPVAAAGRRHAFRLGAPRREASAS